MPPKKKGKGKKKGKKGKKGKKSGPAAVYPKVFPEGTREYYMDRIKQLQQQVAKYQDREHALEQENIEIRVQGQGFQGSMLTRIRGDEDYQRADTELRDKYREMEEDREYKAIKVKMEQDTEHLLNLRAKVEKAQKEQQEQKERYKDQISSLKVQFQETRANLTTERTTLERRLRELEQFKKDKAGLLERVAWMERTLEERERQHEAEVAASHEKQRTDEEIYKKNMLEHLRRSAMTFRKDSQRFMPETTKRTVHDNVIVKDQMGKMGDTMARMEDENAELRETCEEQAEHIRFLKQREKELAKESVSSSKIVQLLSRKAHEQDVMLARQEHGEERGEDLTDTQDAFRADIMASTKLTKFAKRKSKENRSKRLEQEAELRTLKEEIESMETAIRQSVHTLTRLQALPHQMCSTSPLPPPVDETLKDLLGHIEEGLEPKSSVAEENVREPEAPIPGYMTRPPLPPVPSTGLKTVHETENDT